MRLLEHLDGFAGFFRSVFERFVQRWLRLCADVENDACQLGDHRGGFALVEAAGEAVDKEKGRMKLWRFAEGEILLK